MGTGSGPFLLRDVREREILSCRVHLRLTLKLEWFGWSLCHVVVEECNNVKKTTAEFMLKLKNNDNVQAGSLASLDLQLQLQLLPGPKSSRALTTIKYDVKRS